MEKNPTEKLPENIQQAVDLLAAVLSRIKKNGSKIAPEDEKFTPLKRMS